MVSKSIFFGTSGIRGDAEKLFTNQFSFDIGRAFSIFLKVNNCQGFIALSYDPRESSPRIKNAVISGLIFEGCLVFDEGVTPIPSINYLLKIDPGCAGSMMITGSHIKPHLNGIKFFAFKEEILKSHEKDIEQIYLKIRNRISYRNLSHKANLESRAIIEYQNYLLQKAIKVSHALKIVIDCGNGAQSDLFPLVLKHLGHDVIEINTSIQQIFLSRDTEVEGDFSNLQNVVIKRKADLGIGFDSDGDRVIFIDEKGRFIPGDYTGTIIAKEVRSSEVVTPINTSQVIDYIHKKIFRTKVGSPYVVEKMKELDCDFGFEANGGGIFKEMRSRDGGRTAIEILNILIRNNAILSDLVSELPKFYLLRDKFEYNLELKDFILKKAKEKYKGSKFEELDGLKIWLNKNTWILFRSSANAPEFRVFVESDSKEVAANLLNDNLKFVKNITKEK